jgi:hypothetical protein
VKKVLENNADNNADIGIDDLMEFKDSAKNYYCWSKMTVTTGLLMLV